MHVNDVIVHVYRLDFLSRRLRSSLSKSNLLEIISENYGKALPDLESAIVKDGYVSYRYADSLKERFPAGEEAILSGKTNPADIYAYALNCVKGRWPEAEPILSRMPVVSTAYAYNVLHDRFPAGEKTVMEKGSGSVIYNYAKKFFNGHWEEAEKFIKDRASSDPSGENIEKVYTYYIYSKDDSKDDRAPEDVENIFLKNAFFAYRYAKYILRERWLEAEPLISQSKWDEDYADWVSLLPGVTEYPVELLQYHKNPE